MRLWSLHPRYLDPKGLVALWREGLLAQAVLAGKTRGYRHHPQLHRFQESPDPIVSIVTYLRVVQEEATRRGYRFDATRLLPLSEPSGSIRLMLTEGQLDWESGHLRLKLTGRDPQWLACWTPPPFTPHPLFQLTPGPIAPWEKP